MLPYNYFKTSLILGSSNDSELPAQPSNVESKSDEGKILAEGNIRDMIEMGFWTIRFLEGFEQRYEKNGRSEDRAGQKDGKIWSSNARVVVKLMRYVAKFLSTFEKFKKNNSR